VKYILLLLLSTQAQADYVWVQEHEPCTRYSWTKVDMSTVTTIKAVAITVREGNGVCAIYSELSEDEAKKWFNPVDKLSIWEHEIYHAKTGMNHQDMRASK
jgi:hypothetical protein